MVSAAEVCCRSADFADGADAEVFAEERSEPARECFLKNPAGRKTTVFVVEVFAEVQAVPAEQAAAAEQVSEPVPVREPWAAAVLSEVHFCVSVLSERFPAPQR